MALTRKGAIAQEMPIFFTPPPGFGGRYTRLWKGGSAPQAPDPVATAQAQGEANLKAGQQSAELSRYDQTTPFGSSKWAQDPNDPEKWSNTFTLDPEVQKMLDAYYASANNPSAPVTTDGLQTVDSGAGYRAGADAATAGAQSSIDAGTAGANAASAAAAAAMQQSGAVSANSGSLADSQINRLKALYGTDFNYDKAPAMPEANEAARKAIEDAYYKKETSRLDPRFSNDEAAMRSRLANQGLTEGSEAYNKELQQFLMGKNDAYSGATNEAILNSTTEMQKLFGMGLAARQQGVSEANTIRALPTAEAQAAMGLYGSASGINNANISSQINASQAQLAGAGAQIGLANSSSNRSAQAAATDQSLRGQGLNERLAVHGNEQSDRTAMLNQLMALRTGAQTAAPGAGQIQVGAAPVAQSIYNNYQGQQQQYASDVASSNSTTGAVGAIGAAAITAIAMY